MESTTLLPGSWIGIAATAGHVGLASLVLRRAKHSPLRFPLIMLCLNMAVWSFSAAAYDLFGGFGWRWLELTAAPFFVPLELHVVLAFVGRRRRHAFFLAVVYLYFFALAAISSVWAIVWGISEPSAETQTWAVFYVGGLLPPLVYVVYRLTRHMKRAINTEEVARTQLILGGLLAGFALGATELLDNFFPAISGFGHAGTLAVTSTLTIVALRFRLFEYEVATSNWLIATMLALFSVAGYLLFFGTSRVAFALFLFTALAVVAVVGIREVAVSAARRRDRMEQFATLGRFSAQMAHDLKNPLTALKGAVQFMEGELADPTSIEDPGEVVDLMNEQVRRIESIIDRYQRMSSVTPKRASFDLGAMIEEQVRAARLSTSDVDFEVELADDVPEYEGDEELLALVLQNLLRNAIEAMPDGGTIRIGLSSEWDTGILVTVADTGEGMDVRELERAFDDFYTTKAAGSGLGLAFARRVVEAHGGRIELTSAVDVGTEVAVHLPPE